MDWSIPRNPGQKGYHRDLAERGFNSGINNRNNFRINNAATISGGPLMQAIIHTNTWQKKRGTGNG